MRLTALSIFTFALALTLHSEQPAQGLVVAMSADRTDAIYRIGEIATFTFKVTSDGKAATEAKEAQCVFSKDGWRPQAAQRVELKDGVGTITGSLDEPGFLQLRVTVPGLKTAALAGAAFDPLKIQPSLPVPDDFDAFWTRQKAALAAVEMKFTLTPVTGPSKKVDAFDAQITCLGAPVSGYFGRPKEAKPKSLPAILFTHGAGVGGSNLNATFWAEREGGMLAMDINAHGLPNGKDAAFYKEQENGPLKNYRYVGRDDRETNYFKGMFLRLIRAIDFLTTQPEWDGKTVIVYGSSRGGFQAFAAAGLDERVTFFCAGVPAGCDHSGIVLDRINGWPKLVTITDGKPNDAELQTARYFDNVNFARRSHAKGAAVTAGFIDNTCPSTSIFAAYNALTIPKTIHTDPLSGHTNTPAASAFMQAAAFKHVRDMRQ